jgi:hypothetical protein
MRSLRLQSFHTAQLLAPLSPGQRLSGLRGMLVFALLVLFSLACTLPT